MTTLEKYYEVCEECFQPFGDNGPCLHWIFEKYDTNPVLMWSNEILKNNKETYGNQILEHMKNNESKETYGNPWNILETNQELKDEVMENKPKNKVKMVKRGRKAVSFNILYNNVEKKELVEEFKEIIKCDCWSIYIRDNKNIPIKVYYDFRKKKNQEYNQIRENLAEDPSELFDYMNEDYQVCFILGQKEFMDIYAYKTPNNAKYTMIEIEYPN